MLISELHLYYWILPPNTISVSISQGTSVNIIVGSHVWVEDPKVAWIDGEVNKINGEEVEIQTSNGKKVTMLISNDLSCSLLLHPISFVKEYFRS